MLAGELDRLITLQAPSGAPDDYGQAAPTYSDVATVWASYKPAPLREFSASRAAEAAIDATFRIRWRSDVQATWRIQFGELSFDIASYAEIGRREGLEILARARQP
jgi:SPP1 family predicted phage head-tail adaptor